MRKLTLTEIDHVLNGLHHYIPSNQMTELTERFLENIKKPIRTELEKAMIVDHPDYIQHLRKKIIQAWERVLIAPGESVGVICAQSIGERQTQLTLNSFHQSGLSVATVVSGVPRFVELLNATKELKMSSNQFRLIQSFDRPSDLRRFIGDRLVFLTLQQLVIETKISMDKDDEYWYDAFESVYSNAFRDYHACISFRLDLQTLFQNRITMYHIKEKIEGVYSDVCVVFSPFHLAQLDVFVDITSIQLTEISSFLTEENYHTIYLEDVVQPRLLDVQVSGITNISKYHIMKCHVSNNWIIQTEGSNLRDIISTAFIIPSSVTSNNMWEIYDIMGIEAVREFLIEEFTNVVSSDGTFINRCHILLLVDLMTYHGVINSVSRYGMKKEQIGVLSRSSFEESLDHFANAAFYAEKEPVTAVSASIMCAKRPNIGSGFCKLLMNLEMLENSPVESFS